MGTAVVTCALLSLAGASRHRNLAGATLNFTELYQYQWDIYIDSKDCIYGPEPHGWYVAAISCFSAKQQVYKLPLNDRIKTVWDTFLASISSGNVFRTTQSPVTRDNNPVLIYSIINATDPSPHYFTRQRMECNAMDEMRFSVYYLKSSVIYISATRSYLLPKGKLLSDNLLTQPPKLLSILLALRVLGSGAYLAVIQICTRMCYY